MDIINSIHNKIYRLILSIHHFLIEPNETHSHTSIALISEIERDLDRYIKMEEDESYLESKKELKNLNLIRENIQGVKGYVPLFQEFITKGSYEKIKLIELESFGYNIESLVNEINKIHFNIISRKVTDSYKKMSIIMILYPESCVIT